MGQRAWQPYEYWSAKDLWERITSIAYTLLEVHNEALKSTPRIKIHELEDEIIRRMKSCGVADANYMRLLEFRNLTIPHLLLEENNDE